MVSLSYSRTGLFSCPLNRGLGPIRTLELPPTRDLNQATWVRRRNSACRHQPRYFPRELSPNNSRLGPTASSPSARGQAPERCCVPLGGSRGVPQYAVGYVGELHRIVHMYVGATNLSLPPCRAQEECTHQSITGRQALRVFQNLDYSSSLFIFEPSFLVNPSLSKVGLNLTAGRFLLHTSQTPRKCSVRPPPLNPLLSQGCLSQLSTFAGSRQIMLFSSATAVPSKVENSPYLGYIIRISPALEI